VLRKIDAAMPAEEIGDRARNVGSYVNTITMGLIPNFYLGGARCCSTWDASTDGRAGRHHVRPRLRAPREHGISPFPRARLPSDSNQRAQVHTERQTQTFEADALGVKPGDRLHTAFGHFMATVSAYGFLSHCECRLSFNNHGPYRTSAAR